MRDWLTSDFHWKAFSLLMAVGIWLTVHRISAEPGKQGTGAADRTDTFDISLTVTSASGSPQNVQMMPQTVDVSVSGPAEIMNDLQASQIHAYVDLSGLTSAQNLSRDVQVSLPRGVTFEDVEPSQVNVSFPKTQ
jgi:YbbR domain-containing protein